MLTTCIRCVFCGKQAENREVISYWVQFGAPGQAKIKSPAGELDFSSRFYLPQQGEGWGTSLGEGTLRI